MLLQRVITALVLAPLMLAGIFLLPDFWFRIFIGLIVLFGSWEWANISGFSQLSARFGVSLVTALVLVSLHCLLPATSHAWLALILVFLVWWVLAIVLVVAYPKGSGWLKSRGLRLVASLPVFCGFWMGLVWLKAQEQSVLLLTWLMLLVWGADIGAYFSGRAWGTRKLAPQVSPGKTWAGAYGGVSSAIVVSVLLVHFYLPAHSWKGWLWLVCLSVAVVAVSVVGDLFESLLKRNRGIKDSSSLLPGHGGVLDRIDSLCAATPMFVLLWYVLSVI
jgi:phosphatidate cytidylyltransferase